MFVNGFPHILFPFPLQIPRKILIRGACALAHPQSRIRFHSFPESEQDISTPNNLLEDHA
jgi:hypothetical protein